MIQHGLWKNDRDNLSQFKKAFDTVDTDCLLHKLSCIGVNNIQFEWFRSCLGNKQESISYGGTISDKLAVTCGIPVPSHMAQC